MNSQQLAYFRELLTQWRNRLWNEERGLRAALQNDDSASADPLDHGVQMATRDFDLTTKLRTRQLIAQINAALERIEDGSYGFCLESGEQIGLRRLEIVPFATLSVECQEKKERMRQLYRQW
jgi:DnaK suppressor protein